RVTIMSPRSTTTFAFTRPRRIGSGGVTRSPARAISIASMTDDLPASFSPASPTAEASAFGSIDTADRRLMFCASNRTMCIARQFSMRVRERIGCGVAGSDDERLAANPRVQRNGRIVQHHPDVALLVDIVVRDGDLDVIARVASREVSRDHQIVVIHDAISLS